MASRSNRTADDHRTERCRRRARSGCRDPAERSEHKPRHPRGPCSARICCHCSTGDIEAFARIVTSDAVVEYALEEPGRYLTVEAAALSVKRSGNFKQTKIGAHISNLWIYPTSDSNVVFVHYTTRSDGRSSPQLPDSEHLALLEMRGDRIFKLRNLGANAGDLSTLEASVVTRATASSRTDTLAFLKAEASCLAGR
jgi:hypothetical protein